jgi:hypothetical protein
MSPRSAADIASAQVERVRDDPDERLELLRRTYRSPDRRTHLPYRRAASAFMDWQLRRRLLNSPEASPRGSPWWRAVNERLLRDGCEARALAFGRAGVPSSPSVTATLMFIRQPTARHWYRAHNLSIVSAYLEHEDLAWREDRVERFFINLVLVRVLYTHALVASPRLALGWLAPVAPALGDPRLGMTAIFLSLSRVLPDRYPLGDDVHWYVQAEHGFGHLLDVGVIQPRFSHLYAWSSRELGLPRLRDLIDGDVPAYAWDPGDHEPWDPHPSGMARLARRIVRPPTSA